MKQIRLEFPLGWGKDPRILLPNSLWLKVVENRTEAYSDKNCTNFIHMTRKKVSIEVSVPDDLSIIEVTPPGIATPADLIEIFWSMSMANPEWKIPGLKEVFVCFNDLYRQVPIIEEVPDLSYWQHYTSTDEIGMYLWSRPWALVVYVTESRTFATFSWKARMAIHNI